MEAIILGNPYLEDFSSTTPIEIPAYTAEEAVIILSDGYNPYIIGGSSGSTDTYWFRYNTGILTPLTSSDRVVIGGTSFVNTELFRVVGKLNTTTLQLGSSVTISAILDEDDMASNSNTAIPTQQSVKAYVDNQLSSTGIQIGDNITLLTNNAGYITTETDPIFVASPSHSITNTNISNWSTAYSWGNHAGLYSLVSHNHFGVYQPLDGDLTAIAALSGTSGLLRKTGANIWALDTTSYLSSYTETDPIFLASAAYGISGTNISNWNTAYTNNHTHTNKGVLDNIIGSGSGNNTLFDDGTYKSVLRTVGGSNTQIQYNNLGALGGSANFTFDNSTNTLSIVNISTTGTTYIGDSLTSLSKNIGGDLVFTDTNNGSVTLATIVGGATNYWITTTGGIYYTNYAGINNPATLDEALTVNGNIQADFFNSSYLRYKNSNLLLGPDAGDNETGSNLLYIANSNTTNPLIYGDFLNQNVTFNADVYINQIKRLNFGSSDVYIRRDSSNNLVLRDLNANGGAEITLTDLTTLTGYALKSDFTSYTSVTTITAANKTTWNKASVITTSGGGTNFLADDGTYKPGGAGGVTPTDYTFKFDSGGVYYRPYADKTEAGGVSSGGKFYGGTSDPTNSNRLNYDGEFHALGIYSANAGTYGGYFSGVTTGAIVYSNAGYGLYSSCQSGIPGYFSTESGSYIARFVYNSLNIADITSTGINLITGTTYKINGVDILSGKQDTLVSGTNIKTINSTSLLGSGDIVITPYVAPIDGILDWDGTAYNPYLLRSSAGSTIGLFSEVLDYTDRSNCLANYGSISSSSTFASAKIRVVDGQNTGGSLNIYNYGNGSSSWGLGAFITGTTVGGTSANAVYINRDCSGSGNVSGSIINIIDNPTTSGTISGSVLKATIGSTVRIDMNPRVASTGSSTAYIFDTHNNLNTSGDKIVNFLNNGTSVLSASYFGNVLAKNSFQVVQDSGNYGSLGQQSLGIAIASTIKVGLYPGVSNSTGAIAHTLDTSNTLSASNTKILSIQNNTVERFRVTPITTDIGDIAGGNYSTFESDGTLKFNGNATVFKDLYPSSVSVGSGVNAASFTSYNGANLYAYEFVGTGVNLKSLQLGFQLNHDYKEGSDIVPHLHLYIPDDVTGGVIKFYMNYTWTNVDATGTVSETTVSGTITRTASAGINHNAILSFGTISGTGKTISSVFMCRIYRDPADVADTFGLSTWLKSADLHYEIDTIGSRSITTK